MDHLAKAKEYHQKAIKKNNPNLWDKMFGYLSKWEISDLYSKSGAHYKIAKEYNLAGKAYEEAYNCNNDINYLEKAAECYKYYDRDHSAKLYRKVAQIFTEEGRFTKVVYIYEKMAEMYKEDGVVDLAIKYYKDSLQYLDIDNKQNYKKDKICINLTKLYLKQERYIEIYKLLGSLDTNNSYGRMYKLLACMCYLVDNLDTIGARKFDIGEQQYIFDTIILMIEEEDIDGLIDIHITDLTDGNMIYQVLEKIKQKIKNNNKELNLDDSIDLC
jgi:tetratricopeptide (TPR) repeat protein